MPKLTLETSRLRLITPGPADAARMLRYYEENREHLAPWEPLRPEDFYTEEFWVSAISRMKEELVNDRSLTVMLLDKFDPQSPVLGQCSLRNIVRGAFQACHLGYSLHHEAVGKRHDV